MDYMNMVDIYFFLTKVSDLQLELLLCVWPSCVPYIICVTCSLRLWSEGTV